MSSSGVSSSSSGGSSLSITISEKLTRVAEPEKEVLVKDKDGVEVKILNPEYARWVAGLPRTNLS
jgi:hypothetical protein